MEESSLKWLADICDGDARIALNSLQLAMESVLENESCDKKHDVKFMALDAIKDGIKVRKTFNLYFSTFLRRISVILYLQ